MICNGSMDSLLSLLEVGLYERHVISYSMSHSGRPSARLLHLRNPRINGTQAGLQFSAGATRSATSFKQSHLETLTQAFVSV